MNVLFVCTANSARSQMAEGLAKHAGLYSGITSAGTHPTIVNPLAREALNELGIDISSQHSKLLTSDLIDWADVIITLCGDARDNCPVLPAGKRHLHWGFPDPAAVVGSHEERLQAFRDVRDSIAERLRSERV